MITNPSCQTEPKESEGKFHAPSFEDDLGELGGGGGGGGQAGGGGGGLPPGNMTDLSGYGNFVGQPQPQHQAGHYNGHYGSGYNWHHQSADYYSHYTATNPQQGYYGGAGGGGGGGGGGSTPNKPFFDPQAHSALLKPGGFLGSHPLFHNMEPFPRPPAGDFHQALR